MRLTDRQAGTLRWQAKVQFVIFGFLAVTFGGIGIAGIASFCIGAFKHAGMPVPMIAFMLAVLVLCLAAGLVFAWLSVAALLFAIRMPDIAVHCYEGIPDKVTFIYRQSANIGGGGSMLTSPQVTGGWLRHDGRKYAVDLDLFRKIPDQGTCRFHYIRRPGFPGVLSPYLIVDFEPVVPPVESGSFSPSGVSPEAAERKACVAQCKCMEPLFRAADYSMVRVGTDETNGRFGDVSIATCNLCGRQWLHYHVEYEEIEKSGRWFRGPLSPETAQALRPETAVELLGKMEWYFAGGSYFESTGIKRSGAPAVGP